MPLLLTARTADANIRRLTLRLGQEARVGSSECAELSLPEDDALADEHFVVRCQDHVVVETLGDQPALIVGGDILHRLALDSRDATQTRFTAGETSFEIRWSPELSPIRESKPDDADATEASRRNDAPSIAAVTESMSMSAEAASLRQQPDVGSAYLVRLRDAELCDDAIRFIAGFLSPTDAVRWAIATGCLERESPAPLTEAIVAWTRTGAESDRQNVQQQLERSAPTNVAKWIAQAIIFSGGSLAPIDQPVIRPPRHLIGVSILTAHRWAVAAESDRDETIARWIDLGREAILRTEAPREGANDAARSSID